MTVDGSQTYEQIHTLFAEAYGQEEGNARIGPNLQSVEREALAVGALLAIKLMKLNAESFAALQRAMPELDTLVNRNIRVVVDEVAASKIHERIMFKGT